LSPPTFATSEGLAEIVELLERVFPQNRSRAPDLEWQYLKNPAGPARYVNAYSPSGDLIAHYALLPTPPLADPPVAFAGTYFSANTAVDTAASVPGLMVATARALFRQLQSEGPSLVLGVANEKSFHGFVRLLGLKPLGRLSLTVHAPGTLPRVEAPRALASDTEYLAWRTHRPSVHAFSDCGSGTLMVRLRYRGFPLDAVLTTGLDREPVAQLKLSRPAPWTPRLFATFGTRVRGGMRIPERLRPSPLEYMFRVLGSPDLTEPVARYLAARRFEFLDFDVV
jgi:hypothetical protein